jgi:hypothetical protein
LKGYWVRSTWTRRKGVYIQKVGTERKLEMEVGIAYFRDDNMKVV